MFRLTCQADAGEVTDSEAAPSEVEEGDGAFMWRNVLEWCRLKASTTKQNKYKQNEMK